MFSHSNDPKARERMAEVEKTIDPEVIKLNKDVVQGKIDPESLTEEQRAKIQRASNAMAIAGLGVEIGEIVETDVEDISTVTLTVPCGFLRSVQESSLGYFLAMRDAIGEHCSPETLTEVMKATGAVEKVLDQDGNDASDATDQFDSWLEGRFGDASGKVNIMSMFSHGILCVIAMQAIWQAVETKLNEQELSRINWDELSVDSIVGEKNG